MIPVFLFLISRWSHSGLPQYRRSFALSISQSSEQHVLPVCCKASLFNVHILPNWPMVCPVSFFWRVDKTVKSTISFVILSVCPSVRPHEQLGSHWTNFREIWYLSIFRISFENNQVPLSDNNNNGYFTWKAIQVYVFSPSSYRNEKSFRQKLYKSKKTHFVFSNFSHRNHAIYVNCEKYGKARQATDDNVIRRMRFVCRITKAKIHTYTQTYSILQDLLLFHGDDGNAHAPQCSVNP
jgi:hypothetical protein